jgi:hypothetical protein
MSHDERWWETTTMLSFFSPKQTGRTLKGITAMLDEIVDWGFGAIWMGVPYHGGLQYYGLDPIDFYAVDPALGTMDDLRELISESHARGVAVIAALNLGYAALEFPAFLKACDDVKAGIDSDESRWFIWSDDRFGELDRNQVPYFMSDLAGHWQFSERAGKYYWVKWSGEHGDSQMPQFDFAELSWQEECRSVVRFWMETGIDGMVIDATNEYNNNSWEIDSKTITDVIHEFPNTFVLPEGAGKRNDPASWITQGHYNGVIDYALATQRPWEQVIRQAMENGNPKGIEYNLRWYRDRVVKTGGVTWANPWWMIDPTMKLPPEKMLLEVAVLATVGELFVAYDRIFDPSMPPTVVSGLRELMAARRDYPSLCAAGLRRRLPTSNDDLYYAFLRSTPAGDQEMMAVFNFQTEYRVLQVYIDTPADLTDITNKERRHVDDTLQLSLPPFGYRIYEVAR